MFHFHLEDVLSRRLLGKATIFHDVAYPHFERGYEEKSDPFLRGKKEAGASAQNKSTAVRGDRKSDSLQIP